MRLWGLCLLSIGAGLVWGGTCAVWAAEPAEEASPVAEPRRVWLETETVRESRELRLRVTHPASCEETEALAFACVVQSEDAMHRASVGFSVVDASGALLYEEAREMPLVKGENPCKFSWSAESLEDGVCTLTFELARAPGMSPVDVAITLTKLAGATVAREVEESAALFAGLEEHLVSLKKDGRDMPYVAVRQAVAADAIEWAREAHRKGDWPRADALARYVRESVAKTKALMVFGGGASECFRPLPETGLAGLKIHDGAFYAGDKPVFLLGASGVDMDGKALSRLKEYGLNLAMVDVGPDATLASETEKKDFEKRLDGLFKRAGKLNISVTCSTAPEQMGSWALEKWPELAQGASEGTLNLASPRMRAVLGRHLGMMAEYLSHQKMLNSVCLVQDPRFRFGGKTVRKGFIKAVEETYGDRREVNRAWRKRLVTIDDVDIWWDYDHPAYQYDWQTYHQRLGTESLKWMQSQVRKHAGDMPLQVAAAADAFQENEARSGIDRERLAALMDLSGCTGALRPGTDGYALAYPGPMGLYALLRSLAPGKPVFNVSCAMEFGKELRGKNAFRLAHAGLWESAMAGMSASAVPLSPSRGKGAPGSWASPEWVEGYGTACLDLNRLSELVVAFQRAPAPIAILWSMPSKIYGDGDPFLASALRAYEGCSFSGYPVRFVTEAECANEGLDGVRVLVLPNALAAKEETFDALARFGDAGGVVVRRGRPIPYTEHGDSRLDVLGSSERTVLMRGKDLGSDYLDAMDTAISLDALPPIPRLVNSFGYPLEGVRSRHLLLDEEEYLYVINLRDQPVAACLEGGARSGRDLINARRVRFPATVAPLEPMLIHLEPESPEQ